MLPSLPEFLEQHGLIAYGPIFDEKAYDHLPSLLTELGVNHALRDGRRRHHQDEQDKCEQLKAIRTSKTK